MKDADFMKAFDFGLSVNQSQIGKPEESYKGILGLIEEDYTTSATEIKDCYRSANKFLSLIAAYNGPSRYIKIMYRNYSVNPKEYKDWKRT